MRLKLRTSEKIVTELGRPSDSKRMKRLAAKKTRQMERDAVSKALAHELPRRARLIRGWWD